MILDVFERERFGDPGLARSFRLRSDARKFRARCLFLLAGPFAYASYVLLDFRVAADHAWAFAALRLGVVVPWMLAVAFAFRAGRFRGREERAFLVYMAPVILSVVAMCLVLDRPAVDLYPVGMSVTALFMAMLLLPSFRFTAVMVAFVVAGLLVVTAFSGMSAAAVWTTHYFFLMSCAVLLVGMFFLENTERRQFRFEHELERTIADLRASEGRAVELYREAKQAEKAKNEFLAVVSHELRTPMNAIIGFSEIISTEMLGEVEPAQYRDYAGHIHSSGRHLLTIINDILDISRAEMDKISFEARPFDLSAAVDGAITACAANAQDAQVEVVRTAPSLREVTVHGDEARLMQAMTNIVGNAIKFSSPGDTVTVDLALLPDGGVRFSATDEGIGIAAEDIEQIRQPFRQAESAFARNNGGLGLGLAICAIVAKAHDGTLDIHSQLGTGTTVAITIPNQRILEPEAQAA